MASKKTPDTMREVTENVATKYGQTVKTNLPKDRIPGSPVRVDRPDREK